MCVEGKQTVQIITAPCKFNTVSPVVKHERADNSDLCRKVKRKKKDTRWYSKIYYVR